MRHSLLLFSLLFIVVVIPISADLNCDILTSCPSPGVALLYVKNDSGGFDNAHAELPSSASYPNILCCNSTSSLSSSCGVVFLELSASSNAHVQHPSYGGDDYAYDACISSAGNISCTASAAGCAQGKTCLVSMASDGPSNLTNAHVGSCAAYDTDICCSVNSLPGDVVLYDPTNGNTSLLNVTPTFVWYNATDPDSSSLTYHLQVDEVSSEFQSPVVDVSGIDEGSAFTSYTISTPLTLDVNYSWRVRAFDGLDYGNWSENWTFTVASTVILTLLDSPVGFGTMGVGESNDTTDNDPFPIRVRNDGNVVADLNLTTTQFLWTRYQYASQYFQYRISNATADASKGYGDESGSFNWSDSSTGSWFDIPLTNTTATIRQLNYSDELDEAEVDLRIEVPGDEPPGVKGASVIITGWMSS